MTAHSAEVAENFMFATAAGLSRRLARGLLLQIVQGDVPPPPRPAGPKAAFASQRFLRGMRGHSAPPSTKPRPSLESSVASTRSHPDTQTPRRTEREREESLHFDLACGTSGLPLCRNQRRRDGGLGV